MSKKERYQKATDDYIARRRAAKKKYGKSLWDILFGPD